jgi:hypothetical protein
VFDVELDEGKAPLKLPFNKGDDPWMAAHNFLQDNDMSPMFLDQVRDTSHSLHSHIKEIIILLIIS